MKISVLKALRVPTNAARLATAEGVRAARAAVRTHAAAVKGPHKLAAALTNALHPHK